MVLAIGVLGSGLLIFFAAAGITSLIEKERRAAGISFIAGIFLALPFLLPAVGGVHYPDWLYLGLIALPGACLFLFLIPIPGRIPYSFPQPTRRIDERDTMFSREKLVPGSERFDAYYKRKPLHKSLDDTFRRKPGWLSPGSKYYDPVLFATTKKIFEKVELLYPRVDEEPSERRLESDPQSFSDSIMRMAGRLGAHSAGITSLADYHVYSVGGRAERYGVEFSVKHKFAIALTVEMDYHMMRTAPAAPTMVESARQYYNAGKMAIEIAEYIRSCGYPARAHIDANYQVVCPLVARDAGLGDIGRMGLLMTPDLGPRVRIAAVTTDMPLVPTAEGPDPAMIDFCRKCSKCAVVCPGHSIPSGNESEIDGVKRWQIDSESCYTYWCLAGTDCGRCVTVCPFAHPDNWFHRLVRFGIRNSYLFRRLAIPLDDLFYGRRPNPRSLS